MGHEDNLRESEVFRTKPMLLVTGARLDAECQDGDESENEQVRHGKPSVIASEGSCTAGEIALLRAEHARHLLSRRWLARTFLR